MIYPAGRAAVDIAYTALRGPGVPRVAWRLMESLTPRYAAWARARVEQGRAAELSHLNISGTEWPLFGSVFYLWAVENLQESWERGARSGPEPRVLARDAIVAASELVIDPRHAAWVQRHWGADYLTRENLFYRMLVVGALTSRVKLLEDGAHLEFLREQTVGLAAEIDASQSGLLDDYPAQCYPGDVMAALMCIQRADAVLGTDHRALLQRALRGFTGANATSLGLPPYAADARDGRPLTMARGCANSYMGLTAPELWPEQARVWFARHDELFWQERFTTAAFREFPKDATGLDWWTDVDAGPVIGGVGVSASAFGVGAARKNGRFDRAYPLAAQMLTLCWELPGGRLVLPRVMSDLSDAPLLGEAAILWQLTIQPQPGFPVVMGGSVPVFVYIVLGGMLLLGGWMLWAAVRRVVVLRRGGEVRVSAPGVQLVVWGLGVVVALGVVAGGQVLAGMMVLLLAIKVPRMDLRAESEASGLRE